MDYVKAAQPRIVALFLVTVLAAMLLAGGARAWLVIAVLAATALTVAGAAILNNVIERDADARMQRTRRRPTASGRLRPGRALAAGLAAVATGVLALWATGRRPRGRVRPARRRLLRARLHAAAQAAHRLELRARRPRRRLPRAHRLGGDRSPVVRRHPVSVRRGLRLVAAALLGAVPGARGRLPLLGHPDAGRALRRADHPRADRRLLRGLHGHRRGGRPDRPVRDRPMR